jgi:hypothetical protein
MTIEVKDKHDVVFFIDQQKFAATKHVYAVRELLELAGEDPAESTLVLKHGHDLTKLTDLKQEIEITNGEHFLVFNNSPTPVS